MPCFYKISEKKGRQGSAKEISYSCLIQYAHHSDTWSFFVVLGDIRFNYNMLLKQVVDRYKRSNYEHYNILYSNILFKLGNINTTYCTLFDRQ